MKASHLVGMEVYTDSGKMLGKIFDLIIDLQKGAVVRLTLEPISTNSREAARRIFLEKTVSFKNVKAINQIVIVSVQPEEATPAEQREDAPPHSFRYRYGHGRL